MNYQFMMKPLAVMIAASFALAGCNSETASTDNGAVEVAPAKTASINIGVKFPQPEVGAAWVGSATEIEVSFFRNDFVGSLDEAEDFVDAKRNCDNDFNNGEPVSVGDQKLECWQLSNDGLRQRLAKQAVLSPEAATASVELIPGKYRVEAEFFDANDNTRETSVSYIDIGEGTHQIALRGVAATWTAETPLALQLLNQSSDLDWDPKAEGAQTPAQALGITGDVLGMHLPSLLSYPEGLSDDEKQYGFLTEHFSSNVQTAFRDDGMASLYVPVLRVSDGNGGEIDLHPERMHQSEHVETEDGYSWSDYGKWANLAALWQEYNVESGTMSYPEFGSRGVYQSTNSLDGINAHDNAYLMFGVPSSSEPNDGVEVDRDAYHTFTYEYWDHEKQEQVITDLTIAEINTSIESNNWAQLYFDVLKGRENTIVDGSTITGYLIEAMESRTSSESTALPAAFLDAALKEIAAQEGLTVEAASNCNTTENSYTSYSNQYLWDEANSQWVAGTTNRLAGGHAGSYVYAYPSELSNLENDLERINQYIAEQEAYIQEHLDLGGNQDDIQWVYDNIAVYEGQLATITQNLETLEGIHQQYLEIADLNGDGSVELFETGVYLENAWNTRCDLDVEWMDDYQKAYTFGCTDVEAKETVRIFEDANSIKMCAQPFTLKASELSITYSSGGDVIID